jgi:nucleoside 2-deoxyribosyltransferase
MKRIFELDIIDINNSNLIIANLDGMDKVPRHGTAMEVFYASYVRRIPVIAFKSTIPGVHPFFESLVTEWRSTHIKAAESVIDHYLE